MQTKNIVSTPLITGNIGSCKSELTTAITARNSLWIEEKSDIITNSCTGEVTTYNSWQFTDATFIIPFFVVIVLFIALGLVFSD